MATGYCINGDLHNAVLLSRFMCQNGRAKESAAQNDEIRFGATPNRFEFARGAEAVSFW